MKDKMKLGRKYIVTSLAMSMVVVLWVLCIDALFYGTGNILKAIVSIMAYCFLVVGIEWLIKTRLEHYFWLSVILEFVLLVTLFFIFGSQFHWYYKGKEYIVIVYSVPVYCVGYFLRLVGIRKDADEINRSLERVGKRREL